MEEDLGHKPKGRGAAFSIPTIVLQHIQHNIAQGEANELETHPWRIEALQLRGRALQALPELQAQRQQDPGHPRIIGQGNSEDELTQKGEAFGDDYNKGESPFRRFLEQILIEKPRLRWTRLHKSPTVMGKTIFQYKKQTTMITMILIFHHFYISLCTLQSYIFSNPTEKQRKRMGTACICNKQSSQDPEMVIIRPLALTHTDENTSSLSRRSKNKFAEIRNDNEQQELSQLNLRYMNGEISKCIVEFERKNGAITNRFTQRIMQQALNQEKFDLMMKKTAKNKQNQKHTSKNNQLYLPLASKNIDFQVEQQMDSDEDAEIKINKSCLLSQQSRILNDSLFTDRNNFKKQFYQHFNRIKAIDLLQWDDNNRYSIEFTMQDVLSFARNNLCPKYVACMVSCYKYWEDHFIHLLTYSHGNNCLKIHHNGMKKGFPLIINGSMPTLGEIYDQVVVHLEELDPSQLMYFLTGWIPEKLNLSQIKNISGMLQKLSNNLNEGNTVITFIRQLQNRSQYASLLSIDFAKQQIHLNYTSSKMAIPDILLEDKNQQAFEMSMKFDNFASLYDTISINWNPYIYEYFQTCEGTIKIQSKQNKFLLVIPPSSQDLQIRLCFSRHHDYTSANRQIMISLYELQGFTEKGCEPIRTIITDRSVYSDVFIFEYCSEKTQYLLTVSQKDEESSCAQQLFYTITLYSFAEMRFRKYEDKHFIMRSSIKTKITHDNTGYGINSPYFDKNLHFYLETMPGKSIEISLNASKELIYQICVIPDPQQRRNLTKLKLQNIINNSQISEEKRGKGTYQIETNFSAYIIFINAYTKVNEQIELQFNLYDGKKTKTEYILNCQQINFTYNPILKQEIKWLPTHTGPRKRLKSNSVANFQPSYVFTEFFKNPLVDKKMSKGAYQFYIKNDTFREYFDSVESIEQKNACQPPALSMGIFLASEDKKSYKIIVDDAYYVPFGVGFWTTSIYLQQGFYRFILPKMDKGFSKGLFGIIEQ